MTKPRKRPHVIMRRYNGVTEFLGLQFAYDFKRSHTQLVVSEEVYFIVHPKRVVVRENNLPAEFTAHEISKKQNPYWMNPFKVGRSEAWLLFTKERAQKILRQFGAKDETWRLVDLTRPNLHQFVA